MSSKTLSADGLWLCLRPAFSQAASTRSATPLPRRKWANTTACTLSTSAPAKAFSLRWQKKPPMGSGPAPPLKNERMYPVTRKKNKQLMKKGQEESSYEWGSPKYWDMHAKAPDDLSEKSTAMLENLLQDVVNKKPNYSQAVRVARELMEKRQVRPSARHYRAMILANAHPEKGNPAQVRKLLEEMEEHGIVADSTVLHSALTTLAIHPDYILRQEILQTLRERWISLSPAGWHNVVAGYTRERQYEMALNTLSHMESQQIPVQDWLYGILIYNLCDAEEFADALKLMKQRLATGHALSPNLWYRVLDLSSEALNEEMVSFVWRRRVETGYINPSYGVCNNVLTITSRSGNTELAASVFKILAERNAPYTLNDYEALIDTYAIAGDFESALRILCTIKNTLVGSADTSTASLLTQLIWAKPNPLDPWEAVKRLHEEEKVVIPIAVANVLLEYCARRKDAEAAMHIYKELHLVSPGQLTTETFNKLLRMCRRASRLDMASFYLDEMHKARVLPNTVTFQNLILLCATQGRFADARNYYLEMTQTGFDLLDEVRSMVRSLCVKAGNADADDLLHKMAVRRAIPRKDLQKLLQENRAAKATKTQQSSETREATAKGEALEKEDAISEGSTEK